MALSTEWEWRPVLNVRFSPDRSRIWLLALDWLGEGLPARARRDPIARVSL